LKGLELCRRFFFEVGLPAIEERLPECLPCLAAGLGGGSQAYGHDDQVSRDHGWGPGFVVWLRREEHERFAEPLQAALDTLPREFLDYGWQREPEHTCPVLELEEYVRRHVGCEAPPQADIDWLHIPEEYLFEITHRPLFYDASGEVTRRFESFSQYPQDVWKKRSSACLAWLWEWGVKHLPRAEQRGDHVTAAMYWTRFATYAMKVGFLLNRAHAPYHKWLHREFARLPRIAPEVRPLLGRGFQESGGRTDVASQIIEQYKRELAALGYCHVVLSASELQRVAYPDMELSNLAKAVRNSISDPAIRDLKLYLEVLLPAWRATWTQVLPQ